MMLKRGKGGIDRWLGLGRSSWAKQMRSQLAIWDRSIARGRTMGSNTKRNGTGKLNSFKSEPSIFMVNIKLTDING